MKERDLRYLSDNDRLNVLTLVNYLERRNVVVKLVGSASNPPLPSFEDPSKSRGYRDINLIVCEPRTVIDRLVKSFSNPPRILTRYAISRRSAEGLHLADREYFFRAEGYTPIHISLRDKLPSLGED